MKHFFYPHDHGAAVKGDLNYLIQNGTKEEKEEELLKHFYDAIDVIHDKRLEQEDLELNSLLNEKPEKSRAHGHSGYEALFPYISQEDKRYFRIRALKTLWNYVEHKYNSNDSSCGKVTLILFHLVRGNICLRISQCYQENDDISNSDIWGGKAIEIFWHGKNLAASYLDSLNSEENENKKDFAEVNLYHRLINLNLAKYYRDYASRNRRSDFDAALYEFVQIKNCIEDEVKIASPEKWKEHYGRQYALIWMDAVLNINSIHRKKCQVLGAEEKTLSTYSWLEDLLLQRYQQDTASNEAHLEVFSKLIGELRNTGTIEHQNENHQDLTLIPFYYSDFYDGQRYFLLVLLELSRIWRDLHSVKNYRNAISIAIIADHWSDEMDKKGHNIDALNIISSSLRKYVKFESDTKNIINLLKEIKISGEEGRSLKLGNNNGDKESDAFSIHEFIPVLIRYADAGNLNSQTEVIKWYCLYLQNKTSFVEILDGVGRGSLLEDIRESSEKTLGKDKPDLELQFSKGLKCLRSGEYLETISIIKKIVDQSEANKWNLDVEILKEKEKEQEKNLKAVVSLENMFDPNNVNGLNLELRFLKGLVRFRSGEYLEAIEIFKKLVDPSNKATQYIRLGTIGLKARYLLANCYMSMAEFAKAEKELKLLQDTLNFAKQSRDRDGKNDATDAEPDPRIDIDLGYCYMQRGDYEKAYKLYKRGYEGGSTFNTDKVKKERVIMGLNNYAACCIHSINDNPDEVKNKIETARKIFIELEKLSGDKIDCETNLLKGYYTLCVGVKPEDTEIEDKYVDRCREKCKVAIDAQNSESQQKTFDEENYERNALIWAHEYFERACKFEEGFTSHYNLQEENGTADKAKYKNEVERASVYIINLTKLYKRYMKDIGSGKRELCELYLNGKNKVAASSEHLIICFILSCPTNYKISLKAAIALAEWLLEYEKTNRNQDSLVGQMYRSLSYITIYKERGAQVFNILKNNANFRFCTAMQRGKLLALLLAMYKPIRAIKEECCFNLYDKENEDTSKLVHYTSIDNLKKLLTDEPQTNKMSQASVDKYNPDQKDSQPHFRINNCGYMNDVFEGKTFLECIKSVASRVEKLNQSDYSEFVKKYFPQIDRSHEEILPSGSDVYIGSLSVKHDSFPLWSLYAENEYGCNIEFDDGFFDVNGIPYYPRALRDYMISKYTDQDYPLYIVQYIGSKFEDECDKYQRISDDDFDIKDTKGHRQYCRTEAIRYKDLFRLLEQLHKRWKGLDQYLESEEFDKNAGAAKNKMDSGTVSGQEVIDAIKSVIRAFAADRINEIRFLFKNADYEFEGEVRVVYTDYTDKSIAKTSTEPTVPRVYVDIDREIKDLTVRLGSRIEDATIDKYVTWLKHTKQVKKVGLAKRNRYTT